MTTVELIQKLVIPQVEVKMQIEKLLMEAYVGVQNLRKMSFEKSHSLEYIESIEHLFKQNEFNIEEYVLPKYLKKYAACLSKFWHSYTYYRGMISKGKFNLFVSLKEVDFAQNVFHTEDECVKVLRKLEDYWIASNQVYMKLV
jgi:hypothetical protein